MYHLLRLFTLSCLLLTVSGSLRAQTIEIINLDKDTVQEKPSFALRDTITKVDAEASFPGGEKGWRLFLEKNLNPSVPASNRAPAGTYTVVIQFVVDKSGNITQIKPLTTHGYGMENEVIRILKKSPNWVPAMLNGKPIGVYRKQPVTFLVEEEERKSKRKNRD